MRSYFAVLKMRPDSTSVSATFDAEDTGLALREMMKRAGISSTMDLHEYELLEVIGRNYQRVASKGVTRNIPPRPETVVGNLIPETPEPMEPEQLTLTEREYSPYTVEAI